MTSPDDQPRHAGIIDLRLVEPMHRLPLLEQALSVLRPGETLLIVLAAPPQRLPAHLRERYGARLEWHMLDEGPEVWRMCLNWSDRNVP
jgi:uncharacterized protein (DUF2249 family)